MGLGGVNASEEYQEVSKESLNKFYQLLKKDSLKVYIQI